MFMKSSFRGIVFLERGKMKVYFQVRDFEDGICLEDWELVE